MPDTIGHYHVLDRLGAAGTGEVFRARDARVGRTVVLKRLSDAMVADPARRERLYRDVEAASRVSHPHVATLYEVIEERGGLFLVQDFVPGDTLRRVMSGQPLNPARALEFAAQLADALAEAHAHGLVHRDLQPDTVIVTPRGQAKLLDLGLAGFTRTGALRESAAAAFASADAAPPSALPYFSPEQALGESVDHRTDIFSLGVVLYEMLTGRSPFAGATAQATMLAILQSVPPPPSQQNPAVPTTVDAVVVRALAKSLETRYQSAAELSGDLRVALQGLEARQVAADRSDASPARRARRSANPGAWLLLALLALALAAIGWVYRDALQAAIKAVE
jgi:serine/threonine protein kinase